MHNEHATLEDIVALAKRRGFIYPGSEIYGGLSGTYDYGPLGVALKNNLKSLWWRRFVTDREDMYGVDAAILMNAKAWEASGHVGGFNDPSAECNNCHARHRVDSIVDEGEYRKALAVFAKKSLEMVKTGDLKERASEILDRVAKEVSEDDSLVSVPDREKFVEHLIKNQHKQDLVEAELANSFFSIIEKGQRYVGYFAQMFLNGFVPCPTKGCGKRDWREPKQFNMMFKTEIGSSESDTVSYLRPETAGGMFVNFKNIIDSFHPKLPFGMAQIGKAFRNEINPRDFLFRVREFEQMEVEYFVDPANWEAAFEEWHGIMHAFAKEVGIEKERIHDLEVAEEDRAHYSKRTIDFEFDYPFGRKELWGLAYRTSFDLEAHSKASKVDLSYFDEETKDRLTPHVIEPSLGVDRTVLAVLASTYTVDQVGEEPRIFLKLPKAIAPFTVAVFPLLRNKPDLVKKAREVHQMLRQAGIIAAFDDNGNIGKRYRRQDEIGTPYCVTVDFDTMEDDTVTVRDRDTGGQERVNIAELVARLGRN